MSKLEKVEPEDEQVSLLRKCLEEVGEVMDRHGVYGIAFASHFKETDGQFHMHAANIVSDVPDRVGQADAMLAAAEEMTGNALRDIRGSINDAKRKNETMVADASVLIRPAAMPVGKPN